MTDLILYLGVTALGYFVGTKFRKSRASISWTGKVQTVAITLLVICMGARMGANEEITENLSTIGLSAFLMTVLIMGFSIISVVVLRKFFRIDRYGHMMYAEKTASETDGSFEKQNNEQRLAQDIHIIEEDEKKQGINMMTVLILISVIIGMLAGYFIVRDVFEGNMETFEKGAGIGIKVGLCLLLIFVGVDLGIEGTVISNFRTVGMRIFAVPVAVMAGTLTASAVMSLFVDLTLRECLAVGAGFGWYTLAPGIIMEAGHLTASAVCFLHNVMRELFSILFIPLVAKRIGYVETVALPGSAAMDICLPIVEKATRSDIAVYSFVSGVVLSTLVPILVPMIIG